MQIVVLDFMQVLWCLGTVVSLILALSGERVMSPCVLPATVSALLLFFLGYPPRLQAGLFCLVLAADSVTMAVARRLRRYLRHRRAKHPPVQ